MNQYLFKFYNVHPVTFRRTLVSRTIAADDQRQAVRILDRHPSLIKSVVSWRIKS